MDIEVFEAGLRVPEHLEHLLLPVRLLPEADQGAGVEPGHKCTVAYPVVTCTVHSVGDLYTVFCTPEPVL